MALISFLKSSFIIYTFDNFKPWVVYTRYAILFSDLNDMRKREKKEKGSKLTVIFLIFGTENCFTISFF